MAREGWRVSGGGPGSASRTAICTQTSQRAPEVKQSYDRRADGEHCTNSKSMHEVRGGTATRKWQCLIRCMRVSFAPIADLEHQLMSAVLATVSIVVLCVAIDHQEQQCLSLGRSPVAWMGWPRRPNPEGAAPTPHKCGDTRCASRHERVMHPINSARQTGAGRELACQANSIE